MQLIKNTLIERSQRYQELIYGSLKDQPENVQQLKLKLQLLLKDRKQQASRQQRQTQYLHTLIGQKISTPEEVKQFYQLSKEVMALFGENFHYELMKEHQNQNPLTLSIYIYIKFFENSGNPYKANEILSIYQKRLCENDLLLPTLLNWFVEWTRKKYGLELKKAIRDTNDKVEAMTKERQGSVSPSLRQDERTEPIQSPITRKADLISSTISVLQQQPVADQRFIVNRDLFYGAFSNQMNEIYKNLQSTLPDLDIGYFKGLRKNQQTRKEVIRNIPKMTEVLVGQQNEAKKVIDQFSFAFKVKFPNCQKEKSPKQVQKPEKKSSPRKKSPKKDFSFLLSLNKNQLSATKIMSSIPKLKMNPDESASTDISNPPPKHSISRPIIRKKLVELNLPAITDRSRSAIANDIRSDFKSEQIKPTHLYPQKYARINSFSIREKLLGKPLTQFLEAQGGQHHKKQKQKDRYISLTHDPRQYERFSFKRHNRSIKLEDLLSQIPQVVEGKQPPGQKIFCLPKLVKN